MRTNFLLCCLLTAVFTACGDYQPNEQLACGPGTHQEGNECLPDNTAENTSPNAGYNAPSPDAGYSSRQDAGYEEKPVLACGKGTKKVNNECLPLVEGVPCTDNDAGTGTACVTTLCAGTTSNDCKEVPGTLVCGLGYYICAPATGTTSLDFCDADLRDTDGDGSNYEDDPHLNDKCTTLINFGMREDGSDWVTPTAGLLKCLKNEPGNVMQLVCEPLCKLPVDWEIHETCGNGLDDDCDGEVDEGCPGSDLPPATLRDAICDGYSLQSDPDPGVKLMSVTSEIHRWADKGISLTSGDCVLTFLVRPVTASLKVSFRIETEKGYQTCNDGQYAKMKWQTAFVSPMPGASVWASRWVLDNNCDGVFENYITGFEPPELIEVSLHLYGNNGEWMAIRDLRVEDGEQQVSLHCQLETKCVVVYH